MPRRQSACRYLRGDSKHVLLRPISLQTWWLHPRKAFGPYPRRAPNPKHLHPKMASRLTAEMLADLEVPHDVRISPSSQHVVYNLKSDSNRRERWVSSLWLADVGKERSARKLTDGGSLEWAPQRSSDSKSIAFVTDRAKEGATSSHILAVY